MKFHFLLLNLFLFASFDISAIEKKSIRLGLLAYGTVAWEIETIRNENLAKDKSFTINVHSMANPETGKIALKSNAVDMIVADWIWVSRLRSEGEDFTFYPYSFTSGALIVPENSPIKHIKDLKGKNIGIAGGELDKNWLLLQALAKRQDNLDLNRSITKTFGAPPLLNQQLINRRIDGVMNYWHFAARLEAQGYRELIDGKKIIQDLGISEPIAFLGYVFREGWANQNKTALNEFFSTVALARKKLCNPDSAAWKQIIPSLKIKEVKVQDKLKDKYCQGNLNENKQMNLEAVKKVYQILKSSSKNMLTGDRSELQEGTFWMAN